jgi:hypothetical protein
MKHNGPPWRGEPCADQSVTEQRSYTKSDAARATLTSSSPSLSGRDWLAIHDPDCRESRPRFQRFQQRRRERRKAAKQRWMQERRELATPLLKDVQ